MALPRDLRKLLNAHYITNLFLASSFVLLKYLFNSELEYRQSEILFFTGVIVIFRARKQAINGVIPYISSACSVAKIGNVVLYFNQDIVYGVVYLSLCILHLLLLPEPTYTGPENIHYLNGKELDYQISSDKRVTWMVQLLTVWSPKCIDFSSVYSEISNKYSLPNLKFAKVDLARNPDTATKFKINTSALSKQLPTLILFENGQEVMRRPLVNSQGKLVPFALSFENVVSEFDLNNIYQECKKNPIKEKKGSETKEKVN